MELTDPIEQAPKRFSLQRVEDSQRRVHRSQTLPAIEMAKEAASNFQLVMRLNNMHINEHETKGAYSHHNKDWLPVPEILPAGHPLLSRSIDRWYKGEESTSRYGSKQSVSPTARSSRFGSKASVTRAANNPIHVVSMRAIASREYQRQRILTPQLPKPVQQRVDKREVPDPSPGPVVRGRLKEDATDGLDGQSG
ncbi:unnamed protein product [Durusdinium trenchii]|uniref:Uncharacterized protein n=1 Tax=Durusdinium trenchii TaxID=1381693 RepID=A0ABP0NPA4_9DINO